MITIAIINGPNLNLLGQREPHHYGNLSLDAINDELEKAFKGKAQLTFFQSNHEGELIDYVQTLEAAGVVINPGAFTHTSIALRDALLAKSLPLIEVHLSNIFRREEFRRVSYFSDIAQGVITGLGHKGYGFAVEALLNK